MRGLIIAVLLFASQSVSAQSAEPAEIFWTSLQSLCGKAYAGSLMAAPANDTTFKDKKITMYVSSCLPAKIKIGLMVGEDASRTWIVYLHEGRLLLKHVHRNKDGTPDLASNYGGWTSNSGTATRQVFPADQETFTTIPEAAANIWWIDLERGKELKYNLQRLGTDRFFSLKFDLTKAVPVLVGELPDN